MAQNNTSKTSALPSQFVPLSIARMLWKRKLLILLATVIFSTGAYFYIATLPNIYRAESVVLVDAQKIPEKFVTSTVQVGLQDSLNAISQQVLSSDQLTRIITELDLYPEDRRARQQEEVLALMRKDLNIKVERGFSADSRSGAFRISYEGVDPVADAKVVSRITDLFIRENLNRREQRAQGTSDFLEEQLRQAKQGLDMQEAALSAFKARNIGELPEQEAALLATLGRLQAELQSNQDSVNRLQQNKMLLDTTLRLAETAKTNLDRTLAQQQRTLNAVANGTAPVAALPRPAEVLPSERLKAQLSSLRLRYRDEHPEVRRVQAELAAALAAEAARPPAPVVAEAAPAVEPVIRPAVVPQDLVGTQAELKLETERVATTRAQIDAIDKEVAAKVKDRERILADMAQYDKHVAALPVREQQMALLTRDYESSKLNYRSLMDKKISAGMAHDMEREQQSEGFSIADPAHVPTVPVRPRRRLLLMAYIIASLGVGILMALGLELRNDRVQGEWELPQGIAVLGRIPLVSEVS